MLSPSPISVTFSRNGSEKRALWGANTKVRRVERKSVHAVIPAPHYKRAEVEDRYNEMKLLCKNGGLEVRVYNDGAAYRFLLPEGKNIKVYDEQADLTFDSDYPAYVPYAQAGTPGDYESQYMNSFESRYTYKSLTRQDKGRLAFLPLLIEQTDGCKLCITEAGLSNYAGMFLIGGQSTPMLKAHFAKAPAEVGDDPMNHRCERPVKRHDYIAENPGASLPWRVFGVSRNDAELAASDLVFRLAEPLKLAETDWIRPGKVAWDWWNAWNISGVDFRAGVNNETYKYYIDFASKYGMEYIIMDEGWSVGNDLLKVKPEIDLPGLVAYAKEKNVEIILWAGFKAIKPDMETKVKHYAEMGIKGFKIDFMDRDDQQMVQFVDKATKLCAKYKMMVDFHGMYKPTGMQRTWPHVINYEGVFGLENMKWNPSTDQMQYDVEMPFIRQFAGPMDYTQGAMRNATRENYRSVNSEPMSMGTRCHQLGMYMVFDSPLNMLCDSPTNYEREAECTRFIAQIPTVWDETLPLCGKVGEYIAMARRKGDAWFVGALTNWDAREITLDFSFLPESAGYQVELFCDGINADRKASDYKRVIMDLPAGRILKVKMQPGGGWAARITKK